MPKSQQSWLGSISELNNVLKKKKSKKIPFKKTFRIGMCLGDDWPCVVGAYWLILTIYAPVIYTRPCIMFWRRGYTLRGEVGGGWALEFPSFLGPVKWHRADRRVPFGAHNMRLWCIKDGRRSRLARRKANLQIYTVYRSG